MEKPYELQIQARCRTTVNAPASLADFVVTPGAWVETEWLVQNPRVSLYCIDAATAQAIFVELAPDMNLATAPFVYQAQYEGAQRLFALPVSHWLEFGNRLETNLDRTILLFNISRCGSTLLHQIFNLVPGVVSLSEPDGFIPFWSEQTRLPTEEAAALMQASAKFLFRPQAFPHLAVPVIKFRGRNLSLLKLCHLAFPQATLLFLYREAISWSASWVGVIQRLAQGSRLSLDAGANVDKTPLDAFVTWLGASLNAPVSLDALGLGNLSDPLSPAQRIGMIWLVFMDCYLRQAQAGLPITAWRYDHLNYRRQETLSRLFATCGLPPDAVQPALAAFARDSQADSLLARAGESQGNPIQLIEVEEEEIRTLVRCHPIIQTPDFVAPNTIAPSGS